VWRVAAASGGACRTLTSVLHVRVVTVYVATTAGLRTVDATAGRPPAQVHQAELVYVGLLVLTIGVDVRGRAAARCHTIAARVGVLVFAAASVSKSDLNKFWKVFMRYDVEYVAHGDVCSVAIVRGRSWLRQSPI
jgi:hypothetical protein